MKTLKRIFLAILVLVMSLTLVSFDWEGELDPNEFDKWEVISKHITPQGIWIFVKNPDETSSIKTVVMLVNFQGTIVGYKYFKYGRPYQFILDTIQNKYVQYHLTKEQVQGCMKCHSDKLVPRTNI